MLVYCLIPKQPSPELCLKINAHRGIRLCLLLLILSDYENLLYTLVEGQIAYFGSYVRRCIYSIKDSLYLQRQIKNDQAGDC